MTENFRSLIGIAHDGTGPAAVSDVADGYALANLVTVTRQVLSSANRRGPARSLTEAHLVLSSYAVRHDWDMTSETGNLKRVLDGMADAGRGGAIAGASVAAPQIPFASTPCLSTPTGRTMRRGSAFSLTGRSPQSAAVL